MISFVKYFRLFLERRDELKIYNSIVRLPMDKPYGFWMDRHGNFAIVRGGMGEHESVGKQILDNLDISPSDSVYETLFSIGWIRVVLVQGKTFYESGHTGRKMSNIQKRNLDFINDFYDLKGVQEG
jgi:hypothetical protein